MSHVVHNSVRFDEATDWAEFLRDVVAGGCPAGLDTGNPHDAFGRLDLLGQLSEAMQGTPMAGLLATAALDLLEDGLRRRDESAVEVARALRYRDAPGAFDRLLALWRDEAQALPRRARQRLLGDLLELRPGDPAVRDLAVDALQQRDAPEWIFEHAAVHMPEWLAENLSRLQPAAVPYAIWILRAPPSSRQALLTAIAGLGESAIAGLVAEIEDPLFPEDARRTLFAELDRHPAFARASRR